MQDFSLLRFARRYSNKLDKELKGAFVELYRPFHKVPCVMHRALENILKRTKRYPVIIEFEDVAFSQQVSKASTIITKQLYSKIKREYPSISSCSADLTPAAIEALLENHQAIRKIYYDRKVRALLDKAVPSINAQTLHAQNLKGEGITIAVIDTGIYPHPDLKGRIKAFKDFVNNKTEPYDDNGHGTHCAGDAAGDGTASNGKYTGIAPKASLIGVKVLDKMGSGSLSTVMAGVQWCIDNRKVYDIKVISLSLGSSAVLPAAEDPMVKIVEAAWDSGITVCAAAGNEGPGEKTIASPGISPKIITVGAMDDKDTAARLDDEVADFSSRGPTIDGFTKPDILSPGVNIVSLRSPGSYLDKITKASRVENDYCSLSGTSMATPIVAGLVALILQKHPELTPAEVKQRLMQTAENWNLPSNTQGAGYIRADLAVR
ncbi:MAG TPA: S8 family peptidase [Peptococcaceae bacterium]|nr:S8 family peptidase [Peptococcaceae bacterium]